MTIIKLREGLELGTEEWCMALHGNHGEHQCYKKPGHDKQALGGSLSHECYCGVWW